MVLTSYSFFPPFNYIWYQFADCVTNFLADSNPSEVSTPALGWGIRFHFLPHALWNYLWFFISGRVHEHRAWLHLILHIVCRLKYSKISTINCVRCLSGPPPTCMCLLSVIWGEGNDISCDWVFLVWMINIFCSPFRRWGPCSFSP